ncbi:hypothetical protein [Streptomyces nigra]
MSSKISPSDLAAAALDGVEAGAAEVLAEQGSRDVKARPPLTPEGSVPQWTASWRRDGGLTGGEIPTRAGLRPSASLCPVLILVALAGEGSAAQSHFTHEGVRRSSS